MTTITALAAAKTKDSDSLRQSGQPVNNVLRPDVTRRPRLAMLEPRLASSPMAGFRGHRCHYSMLVFFTVLISWLLIIPVHSQLQVPLASKMTSDDAAAGEPAVMAAVHEKFTPEVMLAAPRRSGPTLNADGTLALYTVSTYSFESTVKTKEIRIFDMRTKRSTLITNDDKASEPRWVANDILYLREGKDKGTTEVRVARLDAATDPYVVATVQGAISDVKLKPLGSDRIALVCMAKTTPDGHLWNSETEVKRNHTGVLYDSTFVRHWDHYLDTTRNSLWYGLLTLEADQGTMSHGRWALSELINALQGTELESPIPPFPGTEHFDVGISSIVFVAKDPDLNPAYHTKCDFYHLAISDFTKAPNSPPRSIRAPGIAGAASSPVISPDGKMALYLQMREDGYEADRNRVLLVQNLATDNTAMELFRPSSGEVVWDRSPSKAVWSADGERIFFLAEDTGRSSVWTADLNTLVLHAPPAKLPIEGHTTDLSLLGPRSLVLTGSSFIDNSVWSIFDMDGPPGAVPISSNTNFGAAIGLSPSQISDFWFQGAQGRRVHAWVLTPSQHTRSPTGRLPLAMLIHGGPQSAWLDSWSTRWNPAVFAEQGYFVVIPNFTGSTSYGQNFTDAIEGNWGGDPYDDIVACFEYVRDHRGSEVDMDRAVALGASFGGFMVNWIQGHDLGRKFKALVCHDGVFSTTSDVSQDEQYFPIRDHKGFLWDKPAEWNRWNPAGAEHLRQWATPQLIIHSEKDYRLAMSEGLGAFNVLQGRGVDSRLLYFPDENHWVVKEENSRVWHVVVLNWINKYVGLPPYADEDKIVGPAVGKKYTKQ